MPTNPYGAVPRALSDTRLTLRNIINDMVATRSHESKMKLALASLGADTELRKIGAEKELLGANVDMAKAGADIRFKEQNLAEVVRQGDTAEDREARLQAAADVEKQERERLDKKYTVDEAIQELGMGRMQSAMLKNLMSDDAKVSLRTYREMGKWLQEHPKLATMWSVGALKDQADGIAGADEHTPEGLGRLKSLMRTINMLTTAAKDGVMKPKDIVTARTALQESWYDFGDESPLKQQFLEQASGDEATAVGLFVDAGIRDLQNISGSGTLGSQVEAMQKRIQEYEGALKPKSSPELESKVVEAVNAVIKTQGQAAGDQLAAELVDLLKAGKFDEVRGRIKGDTFPLVAAHKQAGPAADELSLASLVAPDAAMAAPSQPQPAKKQSLADFSMTKPSTEEERKAALQELTDLAHKLGVGPGNWKALGQLAKDLGGWAWDIYQRNWAALVKGQEEARKTLPGYSKK